jgi:hypothetical protein
LAVAVIVTAGAEAAISVGHFFGKENQPVCGL